MSCWEGKLIKNKVKFKDMGLFGVIICRVGCMYGLELIYGLVL